VVEQLIRNQQVLGSSPSTGSSIKPAATISDALRGSQGLISEQEYEAKRRQILDRM
jgi:hypothetical protein